MRKVTFGLSSSRPIQPGETMILHANPQRRCRPLEFTVADDAPLSFFVESATLGIEMLVCGEGPLCAIVRRGQGASLTPLRPVVCERGMQLRLAVKNVGVRPLPLAIAVIAEDLSFQRDAEEWSDSEPPPSRSASVSGAHDSERGLPAAAPKCIERVYARIENPLVARRAEARPPDVRGLLLFGQRRGPAWNRFLIALSRAVDSEELLTEDVVRALAEKAASEAG